MNMTFQLLKTKHRNIIFYHLRTNEAVERFNKVLNHMLIKYCIDQFIKN